jgi:hypothetical protein
MKIVEQLPTLLKLEQKGDSFVSRYFGYLFKILLGSIPLYFGLQFLTSGELLNLRCNRVEPTQVNCQLTSSRFFGETSIPMPIQGLKCAEVKETQSDDGSDYQILLITKDHQIPLGKDSSSFSESQEIVAQIKTFISDQSRSTLDIQQDHRFTFNLFGLILFYWSIRSISSSLLYKIQYYCIFNKVSGLMYMQSKNFFKTEYREMYLSDIQEVRVVEEIKVRDGGKIKIYKTKLALRSGEEIDLQISGGDNKLYEVARTINKFLNLNSLPDV